MKTITVIFVGLIAQVNQPGSFDNTAVVIDAPNHQCPRILISSDSKPVDPTDEWLLKESPPDPDCDPPLVRRPDELNTYVISAKNMSVRLSGTRGVFCDHPQDILDHLPRLKDVAPKCTRLKPSVRKRIPQRDVAWGFFDYRGGHLQAVDYLAKKLQYNKSGAQPFCAACRVTYVADLNGDSAILTFTDPTGTHVIRVPANSTIEIQNIPTINTGSHFHEFSRIFENCNDGDFTTVDETNDDCESSRICNASERAFPFADCTNSQYP